jgi:hypothetical protein
MRIAETATTERACRSRAGRIGQARIGAVLVGGEFGRNHLILVASYGAIARIFEPATGIWLVLGLEVGIGELVRVSCCGSSGELRLFSSLRCRLLLSDMVTYRTWRTPTHLVLRYVD